MRRAASRLLLLAFPLLAGCRAADGAGPTTLRFWAVGREGEVVQELVRDFERENPGVLVRVQQIPWTAAHEKLLTAHVGDATPDMAQLGNTWIAEFDALGALEPLDSWAATSRVISAAGYFPGIWDTNVMHGTLFGVPWYVDTRVIFYRKDLLAKAGYRSPPTRWDEWREAMRVIKQQGGNDRYAIFLPTNEWAQPIIFGLQAGSSLLRDENRYGAFSDSAFRYAFDFYISLYREGLAPPLGNTDMANVYQEFERGLFAMYITGPWNIGEFQRRLSPEMTGKWGTAALPGPGGAARGVSLAGGSSLVIFKRSEHKAEAWKLIEFLSRPDQQLRFYKLTGDLPARTESWQDKTLATNEFARAFWEQLQRVEATPKIPEWELIATKVLDHAESSIRGSVTPADALARLDRDVNRVLEKRRWMMARDARRKGVALQ